MKTVKKLVGIMLITMSVSISFSQKIHEYGAFSNSASSPESQRIVDLSTDIQPTIYLERGVEKVTGTGSPTLVMSDASSTASLSKVLSRFSKIELIEVRIKEPSDLNSLVLNSELIKTGSNLKAIIIRAEYPVSETEFKNMFKSIQNTSLTLLYEVSIPH
jgi:hypothetical protein